MNLNGKLQKNWGASRGPSKNLGGHGPPRPPLESPLIIKLKRYMHNKFSNHQTNYCKTTFLALTCLSYILINRPVVAKTALLPKKSQKPTIITVLQVNLQKRSNNCCCSFNKVSMKRKNSAARKFWLNDKFWLNYKFWLFFDLIT